MLRVLLAEPRGFCAGVVRAIGIVDEALIQSDKPVYVRHEIVHNRHVVDDLKSKGAVFVEELDEIPDGALTVFSAHGVARSVVEEARRRALPVLDATCPLVAKVHRQGQRYVQQGRRLVLIGHEDHPEVVGTVGQIDGPVYVTPDVAAVLALDLHPDIPLAYITQTTLSVDDTNKVIAVLKTRFNDVVGPETSDICYAAQNRQNAVRDLCKVVDVLIVVGASYSSNSRRLWEIGCESGVPSYLVADSTEVDPNWLKGASTVGLTAGASAPELLVQSVVDLLRTLDEVEVFQMSGVAENVEFRLPAGLKSMMADGVQ